MLFRSHGAASLALCLQRFLALLLGERGLANGLFTLLGLDLGLGALGRFLGLARLLHGALLGFGLGLRLRFEAGARLGFQLGFGAGGVLRLRHLLLGVVARVLLVNINSLLDVGDLDLKVEKQFWSGPLRIFMVDQTEQAQDLLVTARDRLGSKIAQYLVFDEHNPNSIHSCITRARENARRDSCQNAVRESRRGP